MLSFSIDWGLLGLKVSIAKPILLVVTWGNSPVFELIRLIYTVMFRKSLNLGFWRPINFPVF